jgi:hypothetical protein
MGLGSVGWLGLQAGAGHVGAVVGGRRDKSLAGWMFESADVRYLFASRRGYYRGMDLAIEM